MRDAYLKRISSSMLKVEWKNTTVSFDARVYATESVPIDRASIAELSVIPEISEAATLIPDGKLLDAAFTPDFHKGSGIPIGTVLETQAVVFPKAAGNDIGCGMGLCVFDVTKAEFTACLERLRPLLKHAFYEGGRSIPMSPEGREAILRHGIPGLSLSIGMDGLLEDMTEDDILWHSLASETPSMPTKDLWTFSNYVEGSGGISRDAQIGSLSGGNHFLEFGYVAERADKPAMHNLGLIPEYVTVLAHNGSVGLGTAVGTYYQQVAAEQLDGIRRPEHGFFPLSLVEKGRGHDYLNAMGLAANFAAVNRVMLLRMARSCLQIALGRKVCMTPLLDSPHNMVWASQKEGGWNVIHRKGAATAGEGHTIIVPGSSGTPSLLFRGLGFPGTHSSAPHGAGRAVRRAMARSGEEEREGEVLPPLDPHGLRPDIAEVIRSALREEAPRQYKPIESIGETVVAAGIGHALGTLRPILTLKRP